MTEEQRIELSGKVWGKIKGLPSLIALNSEDIEKTL